MTPPREAPTAQRVAIRALALTAVVGRAFLELENTGDPYYEAAHDRLLAWVAELQLQTELEPEEQRFLAVRVGTMERQLMVDATWRTEGLGMLAWALHLVPSVPPPDEPFDVAELKSVTGLVDPKVSRRLLAGPALRQHHELHRMALLLTAVHWRIHEFTHQRRNIDFSAIGSARWADIDPTGLPLVDGDLALGGEPIHRAPPELIGLVRSAARERHLAINWLTGGHPVYSMTDTSV